MSSESVSITSITLSREGDEESYQKCKEYLGEFTASTGAGYYLDRKTGKFKGPFVPWDAASEAFQAEFIAAAMRDPDSQPDEREMLHHAIRRAELAHGLDSWGRLSPADKDEYLQAERQRFAKECAKEIYEETRPDEVLASNCSSEWTSRSFEFVVPAQHLPFDRANWSHVTPEKTEEAFKASADMFSKLGIQPVVSTDRPMEFWLSVLHAVQDCERVEAHERDAWKNLFIQLKVDLELTDARGKMWTKTVEAGGLGGVESDSDPSYFNELAREQLAEIHDELTGYGLSDEQINEAVVEHLGSECLPEEARRSSNGHSRK